MSGEDIPSERAEYDERIRVMRDGGASWHDIETTFGLSRQQSRYCYQRGKRLERRRHRRHPEEAPGALG